MGASDLIREDLARSGLVPEDMFVRAIDNVERAATLTPPLCEGYVIPYFNIYGRPSGSYRVRLFDSDPKYKQPKNTANAVYFPPSFQEVQKGKSCVIITEGEKKAAAAIKAGLPCCALGGVDSWRNKIITVPGDSALTAHKSNVQIKLPSGDEQTMEDLTAPLAQGFQELIDHVIAHKLTIIICFDQDAKTKVKFDVQRAAAALGFELRFRGVPFTRIRQLNLPALDPAVHKADAIGLDDLIVKAPEALAQAIKDLLLVKQAFPRHPNIRDFINRRLGRAKLSRKDTQNVGLAILSDLDATGLRLRSATDTTYYFDYTERRLLKATFAMNGRDDTFDAPFTQFLYQRFGLSAADNRLLIWLGTMFTSENPIEKVSPFRVIARPEINDDSVNLQISDSEYVRVRADGITIHPNGSNNILFESDQVEPIGGDDLLRSVATLAKQPLTNWWAETLSEVRLKDKDRPRVATSFLYYLSPFLHRWRGMQLPVELILGESGSGKSTLCTLRLSILTGRANLRNAPQDLKDWHASVTSTGGLHVTDNVQLTDKNLRQRLSDEICRIVTEPDPFIEQRRYYTNADLIRIPVRAVFAITAIQQPFLNADLLQRAMILEFDRPPEESNKFNMDWQNQQLARNGGRTAWLAHHLLVIQRFFQLVEKEWQPRYEARYRLIHLEQAMQMVARVFSGKADWIPDYLSGSTRKAITQNDWVLEGLIAYTQQHPSQIPSRFTAAEISSWAESEDEYKLCDILVNARKLGRYMQHHKALVADSAGLYDAGLHQNRATYSFRATKRK